MTGEESLTEGIELVSHEVRAEILIALAERMREHPRDQTVGFAELRKRVGHDDPGNFNYHLKRLRGNLVEKRDDGYRLSDVGHHFVAILLSGRFDPDTRMEFPDAETRCVVCGTPSEVTYEDGLLRTTCEEGHSSMLNVGPELLDSRSVTEALNIAFRRTLWEAKSMMDGVCPHCEGTTAGTVNRLEEGPIPVVYEWVCENCGAFLQNNAGGCVLFHPAVVSFCYRRDVDVFRRAWDLMVGHVGTGTVSSEEPLNVRVEITLDGDRLVATLDETATVVGVVRNGECQD